MIALDTSVLVRYLVQDDAEQGAAASSIIEGAIAERKGVFISVPVLCELVWVLRRAYGFSSEHIAVAVRALVEEPGFNLERAGEVKGALKRYKSAEPGLVDLLIAEISRSEGCAVTYSFDKAIWISKRICGCLPGGSALQDLPKVTSYPNPMI